MPWWAGDGFGEEQLDALCESSRAAATAPACRLDDIELEIYRSGEDLHLMLSWPAAQQPCSGQGNHNPVLDEGKSGPAPAERPDCCDPARSPGPAAAGPAWDPALASAVLMVQGC